MMENHMERDGSHYTHICICKYIYIYMYGP